jgi:hypothetical protein
VIGLGELDGHGEVGVGAADAPVVAGFGAIFGEKGFAQGLDVLLAEDAVVAAQGGVLEPGAQGGLVVSDAGDVRSNSMQDDEESRDPSGIALGCELFVYLPINRPIRLGKENLYSFLCLYPIIEASGHVMAVRNENYKSSCIFRVIYHLNI